MNKKKLTVAEQRHLDSLDRKMERLREKIFRNKAECDAMMEQYQELMFERYPEKKEEHIRELLYSTYMKSNRSLESVIAYMEYEGDWMEFDWEGLNVEWRL